MADEPTPAPSDAQPEKPAPVDEAKADVDTAEPEEQWIGAEHRYVTYDAEFKSGESDVVVGEFPDHIVGAAIGDTAVDFTVSPIGTGLANVHLKASGKNGAQQVKFKITNDG